MPTAAPAGLKPHQIAAVNALAHDPATMVEAGTLALLRRRGYVGKHVEKARPSNGLRQRTTSPVTPLGRAEIATASCPMAVRCIAGLDLCPACVAEQERLARVAK